MSETGRPTRWEGYRAVLDRMVTPEGVRQGLLLGLRPTDVVISPYGKCGTTWLQQIVHGLRTRGDMDFDDISRVVPWIETSTDLGLDLAAEQKAEPRAFKSHLSGDLVPAGGRYIVSFRDPRDAMVSMFRFKEGWFWATGAFSIEEFAHREYFVRGEKRDYWHHLRSWWKRRAEPEVLLLTFEDMKEDLPPIVERIARFIDIEPRPELVDRV
ncbi:MAG: sulfotransferase domain-containing protein, partial [Thermoanaerobaculia bacterium]|nr:sulfotransferase domain-containing protein [Thermoanaerobaculia bacterium]